MLNHKRGDKSTHLWSFLSELGGGTSYASMQVSTLNLPDHSSDGIFPLGVGSFSSLHKVTPRSRQTRRQQKTCKTKQLLPPCIICSLYNQDTLVKCFLSASCCGHTSALCKQMKSPRPLFMVLLTDACCELPERAESTLCWKDIFIYRRP